jgi:hypothetical protein
MAYSISPVIGPDLVNTTTAVNIANGTQLPLFALGDQVWANDGKRYVYAKANGSISASTAVCTVNAATFLATNSGGAYTSPATAMVTGDYGWFGSASV